MVYEKLRKNTLPDLIPQHSRILIAVSGGPDSVALAHILKRFALDEPERQVSLVITHVNHGVRPESNAEEDMVRQLAEAWDIPCVVHRFDAKKHAQASGTSFQEAAREWRYARWQEDMRQWNCTLLATAHHLRDQAETVLYRLLRGAGTAGLSGIYPQHDSIIRPLLGVDKSDIMEYCRQYRLPFAVDQSNEEPLYVRNKIRLELIPELERSYNPKVVQAIGRTAEILRWDQEFIDSQVQLRWPLYLQKRSAEEVVLDAAVFQEPMAILTRILRKAIALINQEPRGVGFEYIARIVEARDQAGWEQDLPGVKVKIENDSIIFRQPSAFRSDKESGQQAHFEVRLSINEWKSIHECGLRIGLFEDNAKPDDSASDIEMMELSAEWVRDLEFPLVCRTRRDGDRMYFAGVGHKTLKKVFQEEGIRREERQRLPLVASGSEVLWIIGVRKSDRGKIGQCRKVYLCSRSLEPSQV